MTAELSAGGNGYSVSEDHFVCPIEKEKRWSYESYGGKENSVYLYMYIRSIRASDLNTNF